MQSRKLFGLLLIGYILFSSWYLGNPPDGYSSAPLPGGGNEPDCTICHNPPANQHFAGNISISGLPDEINTYTSYPITLTITKTAGDPLRAGFQLVVLDSEHQNAGTLTPSGDHTGINIYTGRTYIEHRFAQNFIGNTVAYTFDWEAPDGPDNEEITFYAVANIANGDGSTPNDLIVTTSQSGTLTSSGSPLTIEIPSSFPPSCLGYNDGSATASASSGTPPYSYHWSNGETNAVATNLSAGTYTVTATDADNHLGITTVSIDEGAPPPAVNLEITDESAAGQNDGSILATPADGISTYTYQWSDSSGNILTTTSNLTNVPAGEYSLIVTNISCTKEYTAMIDVMVAVDPHSLDANITLAPNPVREQLFININLPNRLESTVSIYDLHGQLMDFLTTNSAQSRIDVSTYPGGVYLLRIMVEDEVVIKKVMVE